MKKLLFIFSIIFSHIVYAQSDCATAMAVCGNTDISYTPDGHGDTLETIGGCLSDERYSVWYTFTIANAGTLTFEIVPNDLGNDYDFGVFGPNKSCANRGTPIRGSYAVTSGITGLNMTSTDLCDVVGGDKWAKYMDVLPGETYYLIVNNHSQSTNGFKLVWGGTATLASPFTDPAIQPHPFNPPGIPAANPADPREVIICTNPIAFDFSSLSAGILNGNPNFTITYHTNQNDALVANNPITIPTVVNTTDVYYYSISYSDPANANNPINKCKQTGKFKFKDGTITANDATLTMCNNNNAGTATFDLTTADVFPDPTATKKYYPTLYDLNAGTNEITSIYQYVSAEGKIFVKVTSQFGCSDIAEITLKFHPIVVVNDANLRACFIETNPSTGLFNLENASVTTAATTKRFFPSFTDAIDGTNEILAPKTYVAPNGVVYVRVTDNRGCYAIAKINLTVLPPVKSDVLVDKIICMEDKTTLDAGPGFNSYEWSTGATTQSIKDVGVGIYWVKLKTGECITTQTVTIYPSEQPVVSEIEVSNNNLTIHVIGGTPDYQYSMDNIIWQNSNTFTNIARGTYKVYVKDAYDCEPIEVSVVVPNLINMITPNGDGVNDVVDYSAMGDKQNLVFNVFDRYGVKIHQADKSNGYRWDGTIAGKKIPTGTYWYSVSWNENNKKSTAYKFSGWIVVKNRE
ncbi:T9SS type B sorting domain-containing protein [Chryseobacterium pennipullorum]|uniref:Gliding motility-associated C-terminal domain-containing protein n=1 Tax=Chryseobacterium pennipullorum TaxID=2258963 RepID=A0A3D9B6I0_9FLAO|nr:T9SS type B sorting domain-containing protein [Chryseobacterium pennipullorum]REC48947.1 gliding motility-associated C-terminal domain-containing protein [Chryseobacterium pennipullorum]